jgi:hypothetical protein
MRALSVLSLKKNWNGLGQEDDRGGMQALSDMLKANTVLTDLDMSENYMDATDAKIFSEGISDNGALSSANLLGNCIGIDQARALVTILKEHPTLKSLCGNRGDETELDMSGWEIGAEDAIMLAPEIFDNGALLSLNLSNCKLVLKSFNVDVPTDLKAGELIEHEGKMRPISAEWGSGYRVHILDGAIAVADAISGMKAMTSLDLASNGLCAEGAKIVAEAAKVTKCTPAIILEPFSCPANS